MAMEQSDNAEDTTRPRNRKNDHNKIPPGQGK